VFQNGSTDKRRPSLQHRNGWFTVTIILKRAGPVYGTVHYLRYT